MEFLVRLNDKVNIQVFCFNPVHKGNHMDRVFFEDDTFTAPCPECGSNEWLYRKNNAVSKKGHFITYKPDGWTWGSNELKHYGIVRIDCTDEEAAAWCVSVDDAVALADVEKYKAEEDKEKLIAAGNRVSIAHRHRKLAFDFEAALTVEQVKNWEDKKLQSTVVTLATEDKVQIKEAVYATDIR